MDSHSADKAKKFTALQSSSSSILVPVAQTMENKFGPFSQTELVQSMVLVPPQDWAAMRIALKQTVKKKKKREHNLSAELFTLQS